MWPRPTVAVTQVCDQAVHGRHLRELFPHVAVPVLGDSD
jgi:hypothetical protein